MFNRIKHRYHRENFFPGWLGIFVNPFYFARAGLRDAVTENAAFLSGHMLDIGCGTKPYRSLFHVDSYLGLDIDRETARKLGIADHFYDGKKFPFADHSFDAILCNQVLEHVFNPEEFLAEIHRILKPKGRALLTVPFVWDEHEQPFDFARYSSFGLQSLLERHGFKVIRQQKSIANAAILFQLTNAYLFKITRTFPWPLRLLFTATIIASINILGLVARSLLPANPDLYLDNIILVEAH